MSNKSDNIGDIDTLNAREKAKYKPLTPEQRAKKQERFLKAYRETANIKHACKVAGVSRQTYLNWKANDEAFLAQLPDADDEANDTLELAAYDRAVQGVPSYVVSQGRMVYEETPVFEDNGEQKLDKKGRPVFLVGKPLVERKYSDTLLVTLLKARMPEKYRDKSQVDVNANVNHSGGLNIDTRSLSPEGLREFKEFAMREKMRKEGQEKSS